MVLLTQALRREDEQRYIAQPSAQPVPPAIPVDRGWTDWGVAIFICVWGGSKLMTLFSKQQSDDSAINKALIQALVQERRMLIEAILKKS